MADTPTVRVKRGVKLIDEYLGRSALRRVRIRDLDMSQCGHCVLGQLYGDYYDGAAALGLGRYAVAGSASSGAAHYGFDTDDDESDDRYARLTELWADEIRARRGAKASR